VSVGSSLVAIWASPGGGGGGGDWAGVGRATTKASATAPASSKGLQQRRDGHGRNIVTGSRLGLQCTSMTVAYGESNEADDLSIREVCANAAIAILFLSRREGVLSGQLVDPFHYCSFTGKHQMVSHRQRTTIFGIVFWTLLLASVGLADRYRWLQAAWAFACIGFLVVGAISTTVGMSRDRRYSNGNGYYLPRWMIWVVLDDEQYDRYLQKRGFTAPDKQAY
jgi:hypothetical protein